MVAEQEWDTSVSDSILKSIDVKSPLESINSGLLDITISAFSEFITYWHLQHFVD